MRAERARKRATAAGIVLGCSLGGLLTAALALEAGHSAQQRASAAAAEHGGSAGPGQMAGFLGGALAGGIIVLLFAYVSWRRQLLDLEAAAEERARQLADDMRHQLRVRPHGQLGEPGSSPSSSGRGHALAPARPGQALVGRHSPHARASPQSTAAAASSGSGSHTDASAVTPRRKSELAMIEEFLLTLVGRGSDRSSKGSRSSTGGSAGSSRQQSLASPARSLLTLSGGPGPGQGASGSQGVAVPDPATHTDLAKLPAGFADVSPSDIELIEAVGEGSYGEVWLASFCQTPVAIKIATQVRHSNLTASLQQQATLRGLRNEASLMATLNHPNICRYLGACADPPLIVMEYCARKSLDALLADGLVNPKTRAELSWERLLSMALDAATGLKFLHTRHPPVAHRDLKSANLLVDASWRVKVSDFGLSRPVETAKAASTVLMTNPRWLAPCVLSGLPGQLAADVWAFGTVLWEVMTWRLPYEDLNPYQIICLVREKGTESLPPPPNDKLPAGPLVGPGAYEAYVKLMRDCRASEPSDRPGFVEIVSRLRAILECETKARHPEEAAARGQLRPEPSATLKTFCLPPDGPAHKEALALLQHRRKAMLQGKGAASSGATSDGGSAGVTTSTSAGGSAGAEAPAAVPLGAARPAKVAALVVAKVNSASTEAPASPALQDNAAAAATRS